MKATMWYYCQKCYVEHKNNFSYYTKHIAYAERPKLVFGDVRSYWNERFNDQWYKHHLCKLPANIKAHPIDSDGMVRLSSHDRVRIVDHDGTVRLISPDRVLIDGKYLADALRACKGMVEPLEGGASDGNIIATSTRA